LGGYLYSGHASSPVENVPVLRLGGHVWMSLTPMEVQSSYMPIHLARGRVGTAGLGLGYFVQRVLRKPEVEHVVAYELKVEVLEMYTRTFGDHPKLELRHDMVALCSVNQIERYHWWSIEQLVFEVVHAGLGHRLPEWMLTTYVPFLRLFARHQTAGPTRYTAAATRWRMSSSNTASRRAASPHDNVGTLHC
jgi:hypothetical protein